VVPRTHRAPAPALQQSSIKEFVPGFTEFEFRLQLFAPQGSTQEIDGVGVVYNKKLFSLANLTMSGKIEDDSLVLTRFDDEKIKILFQPGLYCRLVETPCFERSIVLQRLANTLRI
jgi:hypothetical protein